MKLNNPVISIIVPVYNTEAYLKRCLDSIIHQTYPYIEIIVVSDCSPGNVKSIVEEYKLRDQRVKYVEHKTNKGLYHARLTGSELATGDFIAFVDSDDYVSIDYYRLLVEKAIEADADIVEGRIIREHENGHKFVQNNNNILFEELTGERIQQEYFSQEGLFYHWHVIWNKIYKKELWDRCYPFFKKQNKHLIMTEDVVFSSLLFCNAKKYCSVKYDGYFYTIRAEASTGSSSDMNKFLKNITDMGTAFNFVESYLEMQGLKERYGMNLFNWKKSYFRLWANRIKSTSMVFSERARLLNELRIHMGINDIEPVQAEDHFHGLINTPWEPRYEELKKEVVKDQYEVISFDIFDTLILRPFWDPRDLLYILDDYFHMIHPENKLVEFSDIRLQAEDRTRQLIKIQNPSWQDINLDEIYDFIFEEYGLQKETVEKLKAKEIELELKYTYKRESIHEIYKMAKMLGKRIIFVSDMYLPKAVIKQILLNAGYDEFEQIYVSSETRLLKNTGDLFRYVQEDLGIDPSRIFHMGDNWQSDVIMARSCGWNSFFIPKTIDLFTNNLGDKETGSSVKYFGDQVMSSWTSSEFPQYFSTRCMLAVVANKIFDHPYPTFNSDSDFNSDPYYIGYYALGMHTFSLVHWLLNNVSDKGYKTIYFMARDGYLPYQAYNLMKDCFPAAPGSDYLYASRRSLLPYLLKTHNRYGLDSIVSIWAHSPKSILELFRDVLKDNLDEKSIFEDQGIILPKRFTSHYEFKRFIGVLVQQCVDSDKLDRYVANIRKYLGKLKSSDATFDLGYSARLHTIILDILGYSCDTYYVHTSGDRPWAYARRNNFKLNAFYEQKPLVSGILREHLFAELGPSCIGYQQQDESVVPIFEAYIQSNPANHTMISTIQRACIDFVRDMVAKFKDIIPELKIRNQESSIPLEMYIHYSKPSDRVIFACSYSDDYVHGGDTKNSILNWWNDQTSRIKSIGEGSTNSVQYYSPAAFLLYNRGRLTKVIYYALFDRDTLKRKFKERYQHRRITLKLMTVSYRSLRKIKRALLK